MTNIVAFPGRPAATKPPLVDSMSLQDRIASCGQNAFAGLLVSLDDDRVDTDRLLTHYDLEVIRNLIWGLVERENGCTTKRTQLLDDLAVQLALRNPK